MVSAVDGIEAVALAQSVSPDLILMDLGLPRLDGWGATRCLKNEAATRGIPIIVLSAASTGPSLGDRRRRNDLDTKPIHFTGLLTKIEACGTSILNPIANCRFPKPRSEPTEFCCNAVTESRQLKFKVAVVSDC